MFKISWGRWSDPACRKFLLAPDVYAPFEAYAIIRGYHGQDGMSPVDIVVTDLDGNSVDMTKGLPSVAALGTYGNH